jgi:hypothetical protein
MGTSDIRPLRFAFSNTESRRLTEVARRRFISVISEQKIVFTKKSTVYGEGLGEGQNDSILRFKNAPIRWILECFSVNWRRRRGRRWSRTRGSPKGGLVAQQINFNKQLLGDNVDESSPCSPREKASLRENPHSSEMASERPKMIAFCDSRTHLIGAFLNPSP